jgi:hypothetical protein
MRSCIAVLFFFALNSLSFPADAAAFEGVVASVFPAQGRVFVVVHRGLFDGGAGSCPYESGAMVYVLDPSTPIGRAMFAVALSAKLSDRKVYAAGDGICVPTPYSPGISAEGLVGIDLKG